MPAGLYSILRLTSLENRNEYDSSKRDMVVRANHSQETQSGLEVMTTTANVRAVAPVGSGSEHYGSFEYGVGFGRLFDVMKTRLHADLAVFIDEKTFQTPVSAQGAQMQREAQKAAESERVAEGYRTIASTDPELMKEVVPSDFLASLQQTTTREVQPSLHKPGEEAPANHDAVAPVTSATAKPVLREVTASDSRFGIVGVPLFDFSGRRVGALVGVRNLDEERRVERSTLLHFLGMTLVGVILLAGAVQLVFNGLLVRPVEELTQNAGAIAGGDVGAKIELTSRKDEVGALAKKIDDLRKKLTSLDAPAEAPSKAPEVKS
jgi:HAMP domain-containing protein